MINLRTTKKNTGAAQRIQAFRNFEFLKLWLRNPCVLTSRAVIWTSFIKTEKKTKRI
jgi:hypothetical protein